MDKQTHKQTEKQPDRHLIIIIYIDLVFSNFCDQMNPLATKDTSKVWSVVVIFLASDDIVSLLQIKPKSYRK